MILSLIVIALVGGIGYAWLSRGMFSALINLACAVIAGAIAFAAWEPVSYLLLDSAPAEGFFSFVWSSSWAIGLLVPYAISFAVLRFATDAIVPKGARLSSAADMAGSVVLGAGAGVITAGVIVIAVGHARLGPTVFGYAPIKVEKGNVVKGGSLLLPADKLVAALYGQLSTGPFSSPTPLASYYPDLTKVGAKLGSNHGGGAAVQVMPSDGFSVSGRYTLGGEGSSFQNLTSADTWYDFNQDIQAPDGGSFPADTRLEGFIVSFASSATEGGQIVLAAPQVRLISENSSGVSDVTHPVAVISLLDAAEGEFARFRYDSADAVSTKGGGNQSMAFEFPVRAGYTPTSIVIKNIRKPVASQAPDGQRFAGALARDGAIRSGSLMGGGGAIDVAGLDRVDAGTVQIELSNGIVRNGRDAGITIGTNLGRGLVIQAGDQGQLRINDDNEIVGGQDAFDPGLFQRSGVIDKSLRIATFSVGSDVQMVQLDVGANSPHSFISRAVANAETDAPPMLLDTQDRPYQAVGYIYQDNSIVRMRYTPDRPLYGIDALGTDGITMSRNTPGQSLILLFRVTTGVELKAFTLGNKVISEFTPAIPTNTRRR
ncbi:MAG: hypothetical protein AAGG07_14430 [Planctomycetota bacterium]